MIRKNVDIKKYLDIWISGYLDNWVSGYLDVWIYGYLNIWISRYSIYLNIKDPTMIETIKLANILPKIRIRCRDTFISLFHSKAYCSFLSFLQLILFNFRFQILEKILRIKFLERSCRIILTFILGFKYIPLYVKLHGNTYTVIAVLYFTILYCTVLYCLLLFCLVLYCLVLHCLVLYCLVLYCLVLYCLVLYCLVL